MQIKSSAFQKTVCQLNGRVFVMNRFKESYNTRKKQIIFEKKGKNRCY